MYQFLCDEVGCKKALCVHADAPHWARLRARAQGWRVVSGVRAEVKCPAHNALAPTVVPA